MQYIGQELGFIQCFIAGTLVSTKAGLVPIEDIEPGDLVWASDPETGETALKEVVQLFRNETNEWIHVTVNNEEIVCTPNHPFYSPVKGWTNACDLRAGDILVTVNGEYVVVEQVQHELLENPETTYNFEVEGFHTYYVSNTKVLVHNECKGGKLDSKTVAGPEDVGRYKSVRIDVEVGGSGKTDIHMHVDGFEKMHYQDGTFPSAPSKLLKSNFVKNGIQKAFDYLKRRGV